MAKTVIVTGASGGIGAECAKVLAENGFSVAVLYNNSREQAQNVCRAIEQNGGTAQKYKCDVTNSEMVNNTVKQVLADFGRIDVLVNNAGIAAQKLFIELTDNEWLNMINTNLTGAFYFSRAVLPEMIRRKSGKIINIASMWGETGGSCEVHYSAAKAGLIGMTKALAKEMGLSGITVNAVSPGVITTDMMSHFNKEELQNLKDETPLARLGTPNDVAQTVNFLAGSGADFITGQVFSVNGGMVI